MEQGSYQQAAIPPQVHLSVTMQSFQASIARNQAAAAIAKDYDSVGFLPGL
jgi:hypothetical protein